MRIQRFVPQMALLATLGVASGGCLLIPQIVDRIVELAVSGSVAVPFTIQGSATSVDESEVVDVGSSLDLAQILADAGVDVSDVTNVAVSGVAYRITRADPDPTREITNGAVTVQRAGGAVQSLVTAFTAAPGATSGFATVSLDAAGVAVLNGLLADILADLQNGTTTNTTVTFRLTGDTSAGGSGASDFDIEVRVTIGITGTIEVSVPN